MSQRSQQPLPSTTRLQESNTYANSSAFLNYSIEHFSTKTKTTRHEVLKSEDMDLLMQGLQQKMMGKDADLKGKEQKSDDQVLDRSKPYIYQQRGSVVYIRGIPEEDFSNYSYMKPI